MNQHRLAEELKSMVPAVQSIRYSPDAVDSREQAIAMARAYTGRSRVILLGNPQDNILLGDVQWIPTEDLSLLCAAIATAPDRVAAVVAEPYVKGIPISKAFLREVRELSSAEGALLIWDETAPGFVKSGGSVQVRSQIRPDITCFSFGDGTAWLGGRKSVFQSIPPLANESHSETSAQNGINVIATMKLSQGAQK